MVLNVAVAIMVSLQRARVRRATDLFYQRIGGTDKGSRDSCGRGRRAAIEAKRKQEGFVSIQETGRAWDHIELAAQKGLGTADLEKIKVERIELE